MDPAQQSSELERIEALFSDHKSSLPTSSNDEKPEMKYHILAGGVVWTDEGFQRLNRKSIIDKDLQDALRYVVHHRTRLLIQESPTNLLAEKVYDLARYYFPNWIGFRAERCSYEPQLAHRIKRIIAVSDWKIERAFREDETD